MLPAVLIAGCSDGCKNTEAARSLSPDGQHIAVLFQRDCGATTDFTTQISIIGSSDPLSGSGNAFVADDNHGTAPVGSWQGPWAEMQWIGTGHLLIKYAAKARTFQQQKQVAGVTIQYQRVNR